MPIHTRTHARAHARAHTHPFNGPFSRTTQVSRYQKGKTNLDFSEARDSEWQWHQLGHMSASRSRQITTPAAHHSVFYRPDALPAAKPTASKHCLFLCLKFFSTSLSMAVWMFIITSEFVYWAVAWNSLELPPRLSTHSALSGGTLKHTFPSILIPP